MTTSNVLNSQGYLGFSSLTALSAQDMTIYSILAGCFPCGDKIADRSHLC